MDHKRQKIILRDILKDLLPGKLHQRPKHGFEVPLLKWFRKDLKGMITQDLLGEEFIADQGIFDVQNINSLKNSLFSSSPGDVHAHIWALLVFQAWWKKYFS
jgi:asparagine synthase (glutamine-hydrolysing)